MAREHLKFRIDGGAFEHEGCRGSWWFLGAWREKGWSNTKLRSIKSPLGNMRVRRLSHNRNGFIIQEFKGNRWERLWDWSGSYPIFVRLHPTYAMEPGESITFYLEEV